MISHSFDLYQVVFVESEAPCL